MVFSCLTSESSSGCPRIRPGSDVHAASLELRFEMDARNPYTHHTMEGYPRESTARLKIIPLSKILTSCPRSSISLKNLDTFEGIQVYARIRVEPPDF